MFKGMWDEFWGKLGDKERKVAKAIGLTVVGLVFLVSLGQLTKSEPNPVLKQITEGLSQPMKPSNSDTQKPAQ